MLTQKWGLPAGGRSAALATAIVLVLVASQTRTCRASVILRANNYSFDPLPELPADFGPRVPQEGLEGLLVIADPEDGCQPLKKPDFKGDWVPLIMRSQRVHDNCTFDVKVHNAEVAGAKAAIVYDDVYEALIIMSKPRDHPDPGIPAVFVSQRSGIIIKRLLTPGVTAVLITPLSDAVWVSMMISFLAAVLAVTVVVATLYFVRRHRGQGTGGTGPGQLGYGLLRDGGMSAAELRKLSVIIYEAPASRRSVDVEGGEGGGGGGGGGGSSEEEGGSPIGRKGGGTRRMCAVCLEDYKDGEKLRVLPCCHRFHMECIDQWLSSRKPLCPLCKHDAHVPMEQPAASSLSAAAAVAPVASAAAAQQQAVAAAAATGGGGQPQTRGRLRMWPRMGSGAMAVPRRQPQREGPEPRGMSQPTPQNFPNMVGFRPSLPDIEAGGSGPVLGPHPEIEAAADDTTSAGGERASHGGGSGGGGSSAALAAAPRPARRRRVSSSSATEERGEEVSSSLTAPLLERPGSPDDMDDVV